MTQRCIVRNGVVVTFLWTELGCMRCGSVLTLLHEELPLCEPFVRAHVGPVEPIEVGMLVAGEPQVWRRRGLP